MNSKQAAHLVLDYRPTPTRRHRLCMLPAAACCALIIAACGSSGKPQPNSGSSPAASLVKYSACMRSHGVPGFPDPSTNQSGSNGFGIDGYNFNLPANVNARSPAYESADKACRNLIDSGGGRAPNPAFVARARRAALAHAQCMRTHGVPNFPDPTFTANGGGISVSSDSRGLDPQSPAFQQAQKACGQH